jgi:hypothetical protein
MQGKHIYVEAKVAQDRGYSVPAFTHHHVNLALTNEVKDLSTYNLSYYEDAAGNSDANGWAAEPRPGHPNFTFAGDVILRAMAHRSYYDSNFNTQPEDSSHFNYLNGSVVISSMSYGAKALPQRSVDWDRTIVLEETSTGVGSAKVSLNATNHHGVLDKLFRFAYPDGFSGAIQVTTTTLSFNADDFTQVDITLTGKTVRQVWSEIDTALTGSNWTYEPDPNGVVSRAYAATLNGASLSIGVQAEPYEYGDPTTAGWYASMVAEKGTAAEWVWKRWDDSTDYKLYGERHNHMQYYGDPLLNYHRLKDHTQHHQHHQLLATATKCKPYLIAWADLASKRLTLSRRLWMAAWLMVTGQE